MNNENTTLFVSLTDLSRRLSVSGQTIKKLAVAGKIPSYQIGLKLMFLESDVKIWLEGQKTVPTITDS